MAAFGSWELANDGAKTNGGGLVGDIVETAIDSTLVQAYDASESGGTWGYLATTHLRDGYSAEFQLFPSSPAQGDAVAFGSTVPFCEVSFDIGTPAVYDAAAVLAWEYSDGVDSWASLTLATDQTGATGQTGAYFAERDGALSFVPPADWASVAVGGITGYWIRAVIQSGKGGNMTTSPAMNGENPSTVSLGDGFPCPHGGTITGIRAIDTAATPHATDDVKFILMDFTTGAHSGQLTWARNQRQDAWPSLTLVVNTSDILGVLVTQEDSGNADPTNVMLELTVTPGY